MSSIISSRTSTDIFSMAIIPTATINNNGIAANKLIVAFIVSSVILFLLFVSYGIAVWRIDSIICSFQTDVSVAAVGRLSRVFCQAIASKIANMSRIIKKTIIQLYLVIFILISHLSPRSLALP